MFKRLVFALLTVTSLTAHAEILTGSLQRHQCQDDGRLFTDDTCRRAGQIVADGCRAAVRLDGKGQPRIVKLEIPSLMNNGDHSSSRLTARLKKPYLISGDGDGYTIGINEKMSVEFLFAHGSMRLLEAKVYVDHADTKSGESGTARYTRYTCSDFGN